MGSIDNMAVYCSNGQNFSVSYQRGGRSGRVAWQFIQDLAGRLGKTLN